MRTKANFKGHAIHQMLIPFPIGLLTGSFIFDFLGVFIPFHNFNNTGFYMAIGGVFMAAAAAVFGFIDYLYSVPPNSTGKKRASKHMAVNLTSVTIFIAVIILKIKLGTVPGYPLLFVEAAGVGFLFAGGWMGGTLVNRNFIGPDHRHANAGKWKEISFDDHREEYDAASQDELKTDQAKLVRIKGERIALMKTEDGWYAVQDHCTHRGGSLADGVLICGTVQCLWHGSQFDIKTGKVKAGPAKENLKTYTVELKNGRVFIKEVMK